MNEDDEKASKSSHLNIPIDDLSVSTHSHLTITIPSEEVSVHSTRGIPLHTRYTKANKILIKTFRYLLFNEVWNKWDVQLDQDVLSVLVLYTFERTHSFTPHLKIKRRRSLTRDRDIMTFLEPLNDEHKAVPTDDYEMKELVGRTLYGIDIHDSPYATTSDPNPCEIMTAEGGLFLVPTKMSNWYLNQDGRCISLPVRYRFKHQIAAATVKSRETGPYLQLTIKPIKGVVPGTDILLTQCNSSNATLCDLESIYSSADIDRSLLQASGAEVEISVDDDPLAREIAKSYRSTRESVMVVLENSPICPICRDNEMDDLLTLDDHEVSSAEDGRRTRDSDWIIQVPLATENAIEGNKTPSSPIDETGSQLDSTDEEFRGYMQKGPGKLRSSGSSRLRPIGSNKTNPSLIAHSEPTESVLEIGAGLLGSDRDMRSLLHNRRTPNPMENENEDVVVDFGKS